MLKIIISIILIVWIILSLCMYYIIFSFAAGSPTPVTLSGFLQIVFGVPFILVPVLIFNLIRLYLNPPK